MDDEAREQLPSPDPLLQKEVASLPPGPTALVGNRLLVEVRRYGVVAARPSLQQIDVPQAL